MSHISVDLDLMNTDMLDCVASFMKVPLPSFILQRKSEPVRRDDGLKCKVGPAEWVEHREMPLWKVSKGEQIWKMHCTPQLEGTVKGAAEKRGPMFFLLLILF